MNDADKSRDQLLDELQVLRGRLAHLEQAEAERAHVAGALRQSEDRFTRVFHASPVAICITTLADGRFIDVNEAFLQLHGYTREEVLGRTTLELGVWDRPEERTEVVRALGAQGSLGEHERSFRLKSGEERALLTAMERIELGGEPCVLTLCRDVTQQKRLEAQFRQAQKMEAIGRLAGGVAHDFNNLLTIITGYGDMLLFSLLQGDPLRTLVEEIKKASQRASTLTRQLLAFSRKAVLTPVVLDLNVLVTDMDKMLRRLIGEDIDLTLALEENLKPVKADPGQLEQVIMNLVVNARDAMPRGGKLTVETGNVELGAGQGFLRPEVRPGPYVLLAVSDTGCGMDEHTKAHLFEPFFTTKEVGKGTGLGLATVYGIVKQSGGYVYVYSELGRGTSFKIYLPSVAEEHAKVQRPRASAHGVPCGTGTVLLVEDEEGVRTLARHVLQRSGYLVLEARHGGEALAVCEQHGGPIDLLLTDVVMPRMSGRQLADQLGRLRPNLKVLFMSGYTDDAIVHHGVLDPGVDFIEKPFAPDALARTVGEVMRRVC